MVDAILVLNAGVWPWFREERDDDASEAES